MDILITEVSSSFSSFSSTAQDRLQAAGTQLRDVQAKKDQVASRIQEVQAMLAMDTGA